MFVPLIRVLCVRRCYKFRYPQTFYDTLETESTHDANFVFTGSAEGANNDHKVGTMTMLGFQIIWWLLYSGT